MKKISLLNKKILILGANGLIGNALMEKLKSFGTIAVSGTVRKKHTRSRSYLKLDVSKKEEIDAFPWNNFDVIINCIGNIDYTNSTAAARANMMINTLAPLHIIEKLNRTQTYFHCSSYVVLLPDNEHNFYSLSKLFFEKYLNILPTIAPHVVLMRIPGIFAEKRRAGLLSVIKENFLKKKKLRLNFVAQRWHVMYLPRLVDSIIALLAGGCRDAYVNLGYPLETKIERIQGIAEKAFGYTIPIYFKRKLTDHFIPDLKIQKHYLKNTKKDFEEDVMRYFTNV